MLKYRLILGPIMIALLLGVLWLDQWAHDAGHTRAGLVILVLLILPGIRLASRELAILLRAKGIATGFRVLFLSAAAGCVGVYATLQNDLDVSGPASMLVVSLAIGALLLGVLVQSRGQNTEGTMAAGAAAVFAFVYLGLMPGTLLAIRALPLEHAVWVLAAALLTTKSCDIGAYFTGRAIGKTKLIPWLSPGKTWEGLVGGVVVAMLVSLATLTPLAGLHWAYALLVGAVLAVFGQGGDLLASMMKRDAAVKDSGSSVPGFGGVLDVFDSPLLAGPVAYWLLVWAV
ncbi:MAG: phosphatidate cytidylyltransferase [Planctomycetota bacterium]